MDDVITQLKASDFDEFLPFQNRSFGSPPDRGLDWLVPTMYRPTTWHMQCNYAIRRNGALAAIVGLYPITWHAGARSLRIAGIGGVSTEPALRGAGLMSKMMTHIKQVIRDQGYPLSFLGGQRQRYRYFGWDRCGLSLKARISPACVKHRFAGAPPVRIQLEPADESSPLLSDIKALHDQQARHCDRSAERFGAFLCQWGNHPIVARGRDGKVVGYAILNRDETEIFELLGTDSDTTFEILRALSVRRGRDPLTLVVDGLPNELRLAIASFAERLSTADSGNWQVFDWPVTISTLMSIRHEERPLASGSVVIGIEDETSAFRLTVDRSGPRCAPTNDDPDIRADGPAMAQLLFGPWPPTQVMTLSNEASILETWCPLPLAIPKQDEV